MFAPDAIARAKVLLKALNGGIGAYQVRARVWCCALDARARVCRARWCCVEAAWCGWSDAGDSSVLVAAAPSAAANPPGG
jgi:hypothetical protein